MITISIELKHSPSKLDIKYIYTAPNSEEIISLIGEYKTSKDIYTDMNNVLDILDDKFYRIKKKKK